MSGLTFEDLQDGMSASFAKTIGEADIDRAVQSLDAVFEEAERSPNAIDKLLVRRLLDEYI